MTMKLSLAKLSLLSVLTAASCSIAPAGAQTSPHFILTNLDAACRRGGGPAIAQFTRLNGHAVLQLSAQNTFVSEANPNGEASANVENLNLVPFKEIDVTLTGDCFINEGALFEIFVSFIPPGGSTPQGLSFACNAMQVAGHPGTLRLTPATFARDGVSHMPAGSRLVEVLINEQSSDPNAGLLTVFVSDVSINGHHAAFDLTDPGASCTPAN